MQLDLFSDQPVQQGLCCEECGFRAGHAPDCPIEYLPAAMALYPAALLGLPEGERGFAVEEPGCEPLLYRARLTRVDKAQYAKTEFWAVVADLVPLYRGR